MVVKKMSANYPLIGAAIGVVGGALVGACRPDLLDRLNRSDVTPSVGPDNSSSAFS